MTEEQATIPEPETAEDSKARRDACFAQIQRVLSEHNCRVVTTLGAESVGNGPLAKVQLVASWGVKSNELPQG